MRCVVFELAGGGAHMCPPPGRAKVAQTPGRARVNKLRGNSQGNFTVMLNPMGISTNIFQILFAQNSHVRC